jgi:Ni,Fe-hydrogenase I large subunit
MYLGTQTIQTTCHQETNFIKKKNEYQTNTQKELSVTRRWILGIESQSTFRTNLLIILSPLEFLRNTTYLPLQHNRFDIIKKFNEKQYQNKSTQQSNDSEEQSPLDFSIQSQPQRQGHSELLSPRHFDQTKVVGPQAKEHLKRKSKKSNENTSDHHTSSLSGEAHLSLSSFRNDKKSPHL